MDQILPSRYRSRASGEQDSEGALWEAKEVDAAGVAQKSHRRISPTTLAITTQCELRALWRVLGEKGIGPSPFTRSVMDDGKEYESSLLEKAHLPIWIRAINQELGLTHSADALPKDMREVKCAKVAMAKGDTLEAFALRCSQALDAALPKEKSPPFFIHEPRFATVEHGVLLHGQPDLLIWTGEKWLIADIKCSEEAKRTHGMQIATYARIFEAMRPKKNKHPLGVVIHCTPGYRYTATSNAKEKQITLGHTQATSFPLDSLSGTVDEAVPLLAIASDKALEVALAKAVFSSVCVECEFRFRCYPRFLQQRHVSLVPLQKAELEAVMATGIRTIDDLLTAIAQPKKSAYKTLLELKDGSPLQLGYLRQKAERILEKGLYSKWRAKPEDLETPLFFAAVNNDWQFSPPLKNLDDNPTCLVVHTERERRMAWAKIYAEKKQDSCSGMSTFILSEIVQENVHGPLTSITLRPLATMLDEVQDFDDFIPFYPTSHADDIEAMEKIIQDAAAPQKRLEQLQSVWTFLTSASIPFSL